MDRHSASSPYRTRENHAKKILGKSNVRQEVNPCVNSCDVQEDKTGVEQI